MKLLSMTDQTAILTFKEDALKNLSVPEDHKMRGMCFVQSSCNLVRFIKAFDEPVFDMQREYTLPSADSDFIKNDRYSWANNFTKVYKKPTGGRGL